MATLTALRQSAASSLTGAGIKAVEYVAETVTPPLAAVVPDDPYLDHEDVVFGHANVNLSVLLIGSKGTNKAAAEKVDQMIEAAVSALEDDDWDVVTVSQPAGLTINGHTYLGAVITIKQETKIGGQ